MFNLPSIKPPIFAETTASTDLSLSERVIYWTIVLTPIWWLLGIQPLFYPLVIAALFAIHIDLDHLIRGTLPASVWAWLVMSIVMLWTAILGINDMGFNLQTFAAAIVTFLKSYFLIFAALALPFLTRVRLQVITRAIAWLATGFLGTLAIQFAMLVLNIGSKGYLPPLARLLPGGDRSSLRVMFASFSSFLGIPLPRSVLYTPDPPILGLCAILCFLICLGERDRGLRTLALLGSIAALIVSASRSAWVGFPLALLIGIGFQSGLFRQMSLWLASLTFLACSIFGLTFGELVQRPIAAFTEARSTSSAERAIVVNKTLEAWQESPWIGWGVIRGAAHLYDDVYITLGSFSTYAAVLYLNGIVGFVVLIGAMLLTLWAVYPPAVEGNAACRWAFAALVVLYVLCNATPLSWMAVYFWFFFVWLGCVMRETQGDRQPISSWDQL